MPTLRQLGLYTQGIAYIAAGIIHLWHPLSYIAIMPPYFGAPAFWVAFTGWCEIAGGLGLFFPFTRKAAAIGIAAMLAVYFTVHIHMLVHHADLFPIIPLSLLWLRLALHPLLILWALAYVNPKSSKNLSSPQPT
jgi:uncharacterized membrane protein